MGGQGHVEEYCMLHVCRGGWVGEWVEGVGGGRAIHIPGLEGSKLELKAKLASCSF